VPAGACLTVVTIAKMTEIAKAIENAAKTKREAITRSLYSANDLPNLSRPVWFPVPREIGPVQRHPDATRMTNPRFIELSPVTPPRWRVDQLRSREVLGLSLTRECSGRPCVRSLSSRPRGSSDETYHVPWDLLAIRPLARAMLAASDLNRRQTKSFISSPSTRARPAAAGFERQPSHVVFCPAIVRNGLSSRISTKPNLIS
jgi:hypothetical protein